MSTPKRPAPPMMLAHTFDATDTNPAGWWMSEKLDGIRAWWNGRELISRQGNVIHSPSWFTACLPAGTALEGELWIGRGQFQQTASVVRKHVPVEQEWRRVAFIVFDAPGGGALESRRAALRGLRLPAHVRIIDETLCRGKTHLAEALTDVLAAGGEGWMLRRAGSQYAAGRSHDLLKVKPCRDAEATVVGYEAGRGKHAGRVGALVVKAGAQTFKLGTGLTDAERANPPRIGTVVTYGYTELTDGGAPRFPRFLRVRADAVHGD